jgi:hypothetical protein
MYATLFTEKHHSFIKIVITELGSFFKAHAMGVIEGFVGPGVAAKLSGKRRSLTRRRGEIPGIYLGGTWKKAYTRGLSPE